MLQHVWLFAAYVSRAQGVWIWRLVLLVACLCGALASCQHPYHCAVKQSAHITYLTERGVILVLRLQHTMQSMWQCVRVCCWSRAIPARVEQRAMCLQGISSQLVLPLEALHSTAVAALVPDQQHYVCMSVTRSARPLRHAMC
jgi:hypothetical protein